MKRIKPIIGLARKLAEIERTVGYREGHLENDSEHSYQLALASWSANKIYKLNLSDELILKFALVHDLVEVHAGDVDAHDVSITEEEKKQGEAVALEKLKEEYSQFEDMFEMIERYEEKEEAEAQLVYVLDKFLPDVNIYDASGDYYKKRKLCEKDWRARFEKKLDQIDLHPSLKPVVDDIRYEMQNELCSIFYVEER